MTVRRFVGTGILSLFIAVAVFAEELPSVHVLATGGTIAAVADSEVEQSYDPAKLTIATLLASVPEVKRIANVDGEQVVQIASQDMDDATWLILAKRVNELLADDGVDGIVITHGTDTMEETAYFLQLTTPSDKPVVLTGSMRPATSLSADGPINLYNAVALAGHPESKGVVIAMNDAVQAARDVTKSSTTETGTFISPNGGAIGEVYYGSPRFYRTVDRGGDAFDVTELKRLPRVDIIYAHANMDGILIDAAVAAGAKGIVTAGVGNGNMSQSALEAVERAVKGGVAVVRSNRTGSGETTRNHEIDDDALGTVAGDNLSPQKARVLLKLALTQTTDAAEIQRMFDQY